VLYYKRVYEFDWKQRRGTVAVSYNKLWKLMIDLKLNKTRLREVAGVSTNAIAKLSKDETVSMDSLLRICKALKCDVGDIVTVDNEEITVTDGGE
jgi:DNA-binding Xre family transcriptional regulator